MEIKKLPKADLENKRMVFMQIGLVVVLSLVLIASEWSTTDINIHTTHMDEGVMTEVDMIPITRPEEVKPPPPPPPPKPADILIIVEDDVPLIDELIILDTELNKDQEINFANLITDDSEERENDGFFLVVEEMPEFPGGEAALKRYLATAVKYPIIAQENNIQGRVSIQFIINTRGEVTNATVLRGVDPSLDKEALRVVESMPRWKPGKQRNKTVRVSYTVPINFVLQ
ncbi:MAG TPA: energy transducer TonB [Marinilabiliaceae bacterium]|nr:energy transducer TonB [Marinilabiliaceae bacterium]